MEVPQFPTEPVAEKVNEDANLLKHLPQKTMVSWPRNRLCLDCHSIFSSTAGHPTAHKQSTLQLKQSAYEGCHLCSLFYGCLPLVGPSSLPSTKVLVDGPWEAQVSSGADVLDFNLVLYVAGRRNQSYLLKLKGEIAENATNVTAHITDFTGAEPTIATAKAWLSECLQSHAGVCEELSPLNERLVPTRLLYIEDDPCILRLAENHDATTRYLILSYCWGKERAGEMKLTKTTEHELRRRVPVDRLPATVRDAVVTTQMLGYRYLWVDRLCILQGDDDDWRFEALRMGEYYRNADCCIAALSAVDSHQGLFTHRNPLMMQPLKLERTKGWSTAWIFPSFNRHLPGDYPRLYRGSPYPLSKRAWTLQERLLSPRSLYFGSLMIYWECRKARRTEDLPDKQLDLPFAAVLRKFRSRTDSSVNGVIDGVQSAADEDLFHAPENEMDMAKFEERWADLVEFYTAREMTYPQNDRITALSGMMSSITAETGQRFVHGLLVSQLVTELLWWQWCDCNGDVTKLPVRTARRVNAPTWSWGSTTGRISPFRSSRYLQLNRREPWRVEATCAISCTEQNSLIAPTTPTSEHVCAITFSTPLLEACISSRIDLRHYNWKAEAVGQIGENSWLIFEAQIWPDEPVQEDMTVWLLRVASLDPGKRSTRLFAGLAVVPLATQETNDLWKRIGYFQIYHLDRLIDVSERQRGQGLRTALNNGVRCIKLV